MMFGFLRQLAPVFVSIMIIMIGNRLDTSTILSYTVCFSCVHSNLILLCDKSVR